VPTLRQLRLSPIALLALCSVLGLIIVGTVQTFSALRPERTVPTPTYEDTPVGESSPTASWQQEMILLGLATSSDPGIDDGTDPIALIAPSILAQIVGEYNGLQASGTYSATAGAEAASRIAPNVYANVTYDRYSASDLKTDPDSSYARMLTYRADLQTARQPLLNNTQAEYALYEAYLASGDVGHLRTLQSVSANYASAAKAAAAITVPVDIATTHLTLLNALSHFSATIEDLVAHADDPIASLAILRTYNDAETAVVTSFSKLAQYARLKQL
jgi:hypothetical protein